MISGKHLEAGIMGATIGGCLGWTVAEESHVLDGQTAKHGGYSADECGTPSASISIEFVQDTKTGEYSRIRRGTRLTNLRLYRHKADTAPAFEFPVANVMSSENAGQVKGKWIVRAKLANWGPYEANDPGAEEEEDEI